MNDKPIIRIENLHKWFGLLHVLRGISLEVHPSEVVVIIGRSGSGKSTLLRCINLLEEPTSGHIEIDGVVVEAAEGNILPTFRGRTRELRLKTGMVFQEFNLFPHMTVLENVIEAPILVKGIPREQAIAKAEELLRKVGLLDKRDEHPIRLSGGQRQRVAIARALAADPELILADEPTGNLDSATGREILQLLRGLNETGKTLVLVTHDAEAASVAKEVLRMRDGMFLDGGG